MEEKISPNPRIAPHNFPNMKVCHEPPGKVCGGNINRGVMYSPGLRSPT